MATSARACRRPFFIILATFLSISANGDSVKSPPCAAFDCGNGLTLGYPFHSQTQQPPFCGYPNLAISCTNNQPILRISNNPYTIKNFNTSDGSITVAYGETDNASIATCPIATHAVALDSNSPLNYSNNSENELIHFYYNCTVYPPSATGIKCLQQGAKHSYAFLKGSEPESDWVQHCESDLTVPVIGEAVDDLRNGSVDALKLGFKLTWKSADRSCQVCEESGGFCGYNSNGVDHQFFCFCSNGENNSLSCHVSGEVPKTSKSNYVAIGCVVFGGVLAIMIIIFLMQKMKIGVQIHGFNRLPTTHGIEQMN